MLQRTEVLRVFKDLGINMSYHVSRDCSAGVEISSFNNEHKKKNLRAWTSCYRACECHCRNLFSNLLLAVVRVVGAKTLY